MKVGCGNTAVSVCVHAMLHGVVCVGKVECGNTASICMCMPFCMVYSMCAEGGVWQHCQYMYVHAMLHSGA